MIATDFAVIEAYDPIIAKMERDIIQSAKHHDPVSHALLHTIPGVGRILSLVILYEIENIKRLPSVQDFASYCRLVKCTKESNGRKYGSGGKKSVMPISSGHSARQQPFSSRVMSRGKGTWTD